MVNGYVPSPKSNVRCFKGRRVVHLILKLLKSTSLSSVISFQLFSPSFCNTSTERCNAMWHFVEKWEKTKTFEHFTIELHCARRVKFAENSEPMKFKGVLRDTARSPKPTTQQRTILCNGIGYNAAQYNTIQYQYQYQ